MSKHPSLLPTPLCGVPDLNTGRPLPGSPKGTLASVEVSVQCSELFWCFGDHKLIISTVSLQGNLAALVTVLSDNVK